MIRGVVVHMTGEQPFIADLAALPTSADSCLVCTNVRLSAGSKPTYIDHSESTFLFPLLHVRFVEIPPQATGAEGVARLPAGEAAAAPVDEDLELDEEFLRRIKEA
jgi:hypothetical protein